MATYNRLWSSFLFKYFIKQILNLSERDLLHMNIIDELKWRGAINQQTDETGLYNLVKNKLKYKYYN